MFRSYRSYGDYGFERYSPRVCLPPTEAISDHPRRIFPYGRLRIFTVYPPTLFEQKYPRETYLILAPSQEAALKLVPPMYPPEIELKIEHFFSLNRAIHHLLDKGSEGGRMTSDLSLLGFPKYPSLVWNMIWAELDERRPYTTSLYW